MMPHFNIGSAIFLPSKLKLAQVKLMRLRTTLKRITGDLVFGRKYERTATTYGANPMFKERGKFYGTCPKSSRSTDSKCENIGAAGTTQYLNPPDDSGCSGSGYSMQPVCDLEQKAECLLFSAPSNMCSEANDAQSRSISVSQQLFMGDGRDNVDASSVTKTTAQTQQFTRCIVCHDSEELLISPSKSSGKLIVPDQFRSTSE